MHQRPSSKLPSHTCEVTRLKGTEVAARRGWGCGLLRPPVERIGRWVCRCALKEEVDRASLLGSPDLLTAEGGFILAPLMSTNRLS